MTGIVTNLGAFGPIYLQCLRACSVAEGNAVADAQKIMAAREQSILEAAQTVSMRCRAIAVRTLLSRPL